MTDYTVVLTAQVGRLIAYAFSCGSLSLHSLVLCFFHSLGSGNDPQLCRGLQLIGIVRRAIGLFVTEIY
jgi:hypothetical protein